MGSSVNEFKAGKDHADRDNDHPAEFDGHTLLQFAQIGLCCELGNGLSDYRTALPCRAAPSG
jgi:hypothetical protein